MALLANFQAFTHNSLANRLRAASLSGISRLGDSCLRSRSSKFQLGLMLATALSFSMLPSASEAYSPEQEQACTGDAFRLCSSDIPDVDRVTACMIRKKVPAQPGLPGAFPARAVIASDLGQCGKTAQHQAGERAKAGQRQAEEAQKARQADRNLSDEGQFQPYSHRRHSSACDREMRRWLSRA